MSERLQENRVRIALAILALIAILALVAWYGYSNLGWFGGTSAPTTTEETAPGDTGQTDGKPHDATPTAEPSGQTVPYGPSGQTNTEGTALPDPVMLQNPLPPGSVVFVPCGKTTHVSLWDGNPGTQEVNFLLSGGLCSAATGRSFDLASRVTGSGWVYGPEWSMAEISPQVVAHMSRSGGRLATSAEIRRFFDTFPQ